MSHATVGACRSAMIVGLNDGKLDATNQFGFQYGQVDSGFKCTQWRTPALPGSNKLQMGHVMSHSLNSRIQSHTVNSHIQIEPTVCNCTRHFL